VNKIIKFVTGQFETLVKLYMRAALSGQLSEKNKGIVSSKQA
jgi:hypothetical protein